MMTTSIHKVVGRSMMKLVLPYVFLDVSSDHCVEQREICNTNKCPLQLHLTHQQLVLLLEGQAIINFNLL